MRIAGLQRTYRTARKLEHYLRDGRLVVETRRFLRLAEHLTECANVVDPLLGKPIGIV